MTENALLIVLLVLGTVSHFVKRVVEERRAGRNITLLGYWLANPYQSAFSLLGALAAFSLLFGTAELTRITAWSIGYMADSAAGIIGERNNNPHIVAK